MVQQQMWPSVKLVTHIRAAMQFALYTLAQELLLFCPFLSSGLIPSSAELLTLCFPCLLPGLQFSEGGRCDLGGGRLHQPRAPG